MDIEELGNITDLDKLNREPSTKIVHDLTLVDDNINIYKRFVRILYDFYQDNHDHMSIGEFTKRFNRKMMTINKGIRGYTRELNKKGKPKTIGLTVKKTYLVYVYNKMVFSGELEEDMGFFHYIQKRPIRNMSGVNSFAILLPPYPMDNSVEENDGVASKEAFNGCKHNCYYCPDQTKRNGASVNIARSYLLREPAVQRGFRCGWDPYRQMTDRMNSLMRQGHKIDKLELIIEGGTYTEYPMEFLEEFHRDIFYSANVFYDGVVKGQGNSTHLRERSSLEDEIAINMTAKVRVIGICIETRPDAITDDWIRFFRRSGTTRVQLGVQHTNNRILKKINRGHTFEQSCEAVLKLRNNCFKVDIHLMPDLPSSSPLIDKGMMYRIFITNVIQPDQVKIYPCEVVPYTVIEKWYKDGRFVPYADKNPRDLLEVVKYAMTICPPWIRMPRIIRDIPLEYIEGGNRYPNLRQMIMDELKKEKKDTMEIRSREIGRKPEYRYEDAEYVTRQYNTSDGGKEYFISLESSDNKALFGFIRLRLPPRDGSHKPVFSCLINMGLVRELHVYNHLMCVGEKNNSNNNSKISNQFNTQHRGTGKTLLKKAEVIAWLNGYGGTAVITGEGVRQYYHKQGYIDQDTFVVKRWFWTFNMMTCALYILSLLIILVTTGYYILFII